MNKTWGTVLMIFGGLIFMGALQGGGFGSIFFGALAALFGWNLYQKGQKQIQTSTKQTAPKFEMNDEMIIRLAKRLGGRLSVEDLTTQTSLSTTQAQEKLEALHSKGICTMNLDEVSNTGKIYYYFI